MTATEKRERLESYKYLKMKIDSLREQTEFWEERVTSIPVAQYDLSGVHAHNRPKYNVVEQFMLHKKEIENEMLQIIEEVKRIENEIKNVDKPEYEEVLRLRYINGYAFPDIANKFGLTLRQTQRLLKNAIENLEIP